MIRLIDGLGQLGKELKQQSSGVCANRDIFLYHTWNVWCRSHESQEREYKKFIEFVDTHPDSRIVFISTYSQNNNYYVHFKQLAESYLLATHKDGLVIRLPNLVGNKGILRRMKEGGVTPYGRIEFLTLEDAAQKIIELSEYSGLVRSFSLKGEEISAILVNEIVEKLTDSGRGG